MRIPRLIILALAVLTGCSDPDTVRSATKAASTPADISEVAKNYSRLISMTDAPVEVDLQLAALCTGVTSQTLKWSQTISGPHANTVVRIFMNDLAAGAFRNSAHVYPVGSIVIKEKTPYPYLSNAQQYIQPPNGVGGMIKRTSGYDPQNGDWEYFYFEDPKKIQSGKMVSCIQCHKGAENRDYVFGKWAGTR